MIPAATRTRFGPAVAAVAAGHLSRARVGGSAVLIVATLQSLGILVLLRPTAGNEGLGVRAGIVAGATLLIVAFVALNQLAQRLGDLKATGGLDYYGSLPVAPAAVVLGVASAYALFTVPGVLVTVLLGAWAFGLPLTHLWVLLPAVLASATAYAGLGALLGLGLPRPELATMAGQLGMTLVLFIGLVSPEPFPPPLRTLRAVLPVSYGIDALADALTTRPTWPLVALRLVGAAAFGCACLALAARCYRRALTGPRPRPAPPPDAS